MKNILKVFKDFFYIIKGKYFARSSKDYTFAFLVHSRSYRDIYRKYPVFKHLPKNIVIFIMNHLWPIKLSKVTGLNSTYSKKEIQGYVIGITMTADYMMSHRDIALKKIRQALYLAKGMGVKIIGLGGLTSSLSAGGKSLLDIGINITTGHAYTAFNVTRNITKFTEIFGVGREKIKVAVVGAAGSVGHMSSLIIARENYGSIVILDLERKIDNLMVLEKDIKETNKNIKIQISHNLKDIKDCDFVISATNTPEALIKVEHVSAGMIIVDDAQPSDIHHDVLQLEDVLVVEAGVVDTPGVKSNFDYGLKDKTNNFCCMAELLILAANEWKDHYVVGRATMEHIDNIASLGYNLGFKLASFQNFMESISEKKINHIKSIFMKKHGV